VDACSKRLIALAAQKFISDIAQDAMQYSRSRQASAAAAGKGGKSKVCDKNRPVSMPSFG